MILIKKFYNVSDSELKFWQSVRFGIKNITTRQILTKYLFLKNMILSKKKTFLKGTILKKKNYFHQVEFEKTFAHKKSHFFFNITHEMCNFWVSSAILKSTILMKTFFQKGMFSNVNFFSKKHDFEWKKFYKKHDLEWKKFCLVRFWIKRFSSCQVLEQNFCNVSDFKEE